MKVFIWTLLITVLFYVACSKAAKETEEKKVSIISLTPSSGPAGTTVIIKGANFGIIPADNVVKFNTDSAEVVMASIDSLVVIAPLNGISGPVTVEVGGNVATGPVFTYTADSVDVYVSAPAQGVVYWKNGQEIFLESTESNNGGAYGIAVANNNVYVGSHTFSSSYLGHQAGYWKNNDKTMLSLPDNSGEVGDLVLSGNDVYVGGSENNKPVYWKNGIRYNLTSNINETGRVNALAINGSDVYAAGYDDGHNVDIYSVYWKNGVKTILGKRGVINNGATSIAVKGNDVYVCATDSGDAVYWKNGVRVVLEEFPITEYTYAFDIAILGNSVYVVGYYKGDAVYWKDGKRILLPKKSGYARATSITFYQSDFYIGGMDGNTPVYWKNGVEIKLCCSQYGPVSSIAVVKRP